MQEGYAVILVDSTSHALQVENVLTGQKVPCKLIPVPRHLSSDCGVCVRILRQDVDVVKMLLNEHGITSPTIEVL